MNSRKLVVIINGRGGVGKDTICSIVAKHYETWNVSAITRVKEAAMILGWDGGKELPDRKFLSDLKGLSIGYNDFPNRDMMDKYINFVNYAGDGVLFAHIREPEEIEKFHRSVQKDGRARVTTLLIRSERVQGAFANRSDDGVEDYHYDHVFQNDCPLAELEGRFMEFFDMELYCKQKKEGLENNRNEDFVEAEATT